MLNFKRISYLFIVTSVEKGKKLNILSRRSARIYPSGTFLQKNVATECWSYGPMLEETRDDANEDQ